VATAKVIIASKANKELRKILKSNPKQCLKPKIPQNKKNRKKECFILIVTSEEKTLMFSITMDLEEAIYSSSIG
jgi:mRNA-degrading endonuclease RelE of RelBE toxin-antitoxin system